MGPHGGPWGPLGPTLRCRDAPSINLCLSPRSAGTAVPGVSVGAGVPPDFCSPPARAHLGPNLDFYIPHARKSPLYKSAKRLGFEHEFFTIEFFPDDLGLKTGAGALTFRPGLVPRGPAIIFPTEVRRQVPGIPTKYQRKDAGGAKNPGGGISPRRPGFFPGHGRGQGGPGGPMGALWGPLWGPRGAQGPMGPMGPYGALGPPVASDPVCVSSIHVLGECIV